MTTRITSYANFDIAHRDLLNGNYEPAGQDGMLGHLYKKAGDTFRLVKNEWTGRLDLIARNF